MREPRLKAAHSSLACLSLACSSLACGSQSGPLFERSSQAGNSNDGGGGVSVTATNDAGSAPDTATGNASNDADVPEPGVWRAGLEWQLQLSGRFDPEILADVYYLDPESVTAAQGIELRQRNALVACYVSAATLEPWRDDVDAFPDEALGAALEAYPNERWVDFRHPEVRAIMQARMDAFAAWGCDGVTPTNLSGAFLRGELRITRAEYEEVIAWWREQLHERGMAAGFAGSSDDAATLGLEFDFAYAEGCLSSRACEGLEQFARRGKAVLDVEFVAERDEALARELCDQLQPALEASSLDVVIKHPSMDAFRVTCRRGDGP